MLLTSAGTQSASTGLPPAPRALAAPADTALYLELVINKLPEGRVVPVENRDGHFYVALGDLSGLHLPGGIRFDVVEGRAAVDTIPGVRVIYQQSSQQLLIDVPPDWLPAQNVGPAVPSVHAPARASPGLLFNYDVYANKPQIGAGGVSAWHEFRAFDDEGVFSSTGTYHRSFAGQAQSADGYTRYDTTLTHSDEDTMMTWQAGDVVTNSLPWTSAVRLGGGQVARDFSIRPDVITYPLPRFAGETAVPTSVDLFINGYKSSSAQLQPGPFALTNVPYINGAGEAVVVTTDALGRQVSTTIPFYVATTLLRPGETDFSVAAGKLRMDYGLKSFSYGDAAGSGTIRVGVTNNLTLEGHAEAAPSFAMAGGGVALKLDQAGVINFSASGSHLNSHNGNQMSASYQFSNRRFSFNALYIGRSINYGDLSAYDIKLGSFSRASTQVTANVSLDRFGNAGAGYFDVKSSDGSRTRLVNLSWSLGLWGSSSIYLSLNRDLTEKTWSGAAQLVVPLDNWGTVTAGMQHVPDAGNQEQVNYSRAVPAEGGFGWTLNESRSTSAPAYHQADLTWRNRYTQLQGGAYGNSGNYTRWGEATGAVVVMDSDLFLTNRVNESFVLVSTDGQPNLPVHYENQYVGSTDSNGHLLVPWTTSWYPAHYDIDPLNLPPDYDTPTVEQRVAVRAGSGYLLEFQVRHIVAAIITLVDGQGHPLPIGTRVTLLEGSAVNRVAFVGWDGKAYFDDLQTDNRVRVELPDDRFCELSFKADTRLSQAAVVGPLVCVPAGPQT
ncbi:fimbria/pilus outer membrane usher protein [Silvimonas iriomotensis]|uniref:PapC-like C-terminal domain-containing protein n=1 Tax=Silvimonas iriomotensis TaxID=449662 RepID=A0ABQ2PCW1_9NEIS|nr:fimbria/pilus outer membrane usher protein [Silvimonas iriomotensis]GGP23153.1 hypothetical protein GCM10010970_31530 [Silvimonas iriomotensis]